MNLKWWQIAVLIVLCGIPYLVGVVASITADIAAWYLDMVKHKLERDFGFWK